MANEALQKQIANEVENQPVADSVIDTSVSKGQVRMVNSESILLEILKEYNDDNYQPKRLYKLLDEAKALVKRCFKFKGNEKYAALQLDNFHQECQWAKGWIREEHAKNPSLSTEAKDNYLKDWIEYIDKIYQWLQSAFRNGKGDRFKYERLKNLRDGLFERASVFYQAEIFHLKTEKKRLMNNLQAISDGSNQAHGEMKGGKGNLQEKTHSEDRTVIKEANVLRKIAEKLTIWRESAPDDGSGRKRYNMLPENGRKAAIESLRLLQDNADLLQR